MINTKCRKNNRKARKEKSECDNNFCPCTGVPRIVVEIDKSVKNAQKYLRRTMVEGNNNIHRAIVCLICDSQITGTNPVYYLHKNDILKNKHKLSVQSYNENFGCKMDPLLAKQYEVSGFPGLLLSPRSISAKEDKLTACSSCYSSIKRQCNIKGENPPKYAIANGLAIGFLPEILDVQMPDGNHIKMKIVTRDEAGYIVDDHLTPLVCAAIAPVRPHAYILAYNGGRHQSIKGNFQFFEANQSKVTGALNKVQSLGTSSNIYVVLCGPMTPSQKNIVRNKREINTNFYLHLVRWFKAHHPGFRDVDLQCPQIHLVEDAESPHNTDEEGDPATEAQCDEGLFYFTNGNAPKKETSVYRTTRELAMAILEN